MRTITDSTGVEWTVFEVKRQGGVSDRWAYLPEEFDNGWLCFESDFGKRRLTPVPNHWQQADKDDLIQMLRRANPVVRSRFALGDQPSAE